MGSKFSESRFLLDLVFVNPFKAMNQYEMYPKKHLLKILEVKIFQSNCKVFKHLKNL